jgi:carnitine-CoA ligase
MSKPVDPEHFAQALLTAAERDASRPFARFADTELTYGQAAAEVAAVAGALRSLGVGRGDLVAVMLPNCADFLRVWLGTLHLAAVAAPLHTGFRGDGLRHVLGLTRAEVLVLDEAYVDAVAEVAGALTELRTVVFRGDVDRAREAFPGVDVVDLRDLRDHAPVAIEHTGGSDLAMLLFTSGSTGLSKGCMLPHRFLARHAELFSRHMGFRASDVLYCPFPLFHADAALLTVGAALSVGATAAIGERFSVSGFWAEVRAFRATVFDFMGATLTMLHQRPPAEDDADNPVRLAWGAPMPGFADDFERRFDLKLVEGYGSSDAGIVVYHPLDAPRRGACGRPVDPFQIDLLDAEGFVVPTGEVGEIAVRASEPAMLSQGYFGMPEATLDAFRDQRFHTGDLARFDEDGYLHYVGRVKDVIRRRGENISASEVEAVLEQHPEVLEAAAYPVPSELTEDEVMAAVVVEDHSDLTPSALREFCLARMARHMVPRYLDFVGDLPRTATEKVDKTTLRERGITATADDATAVRAGDEGATRVV